MMSKINTHAVLGAVSGVVSFLGVIGTFPVVIAAGAKLRQLLMTRACSMVLVGFRLDDD